MTEKDENPKLLLLFATVHDVLSAEDVLRGRGNWCDMVPVPRSLSSDCAMGLECRLPEKRSLAMILKQLKARAVFELLDSGEYIDRGALLG